MVVPSPLLSPSLKHYPYKQPPAKAVNQWESKMIVSAKTVTTLSIMEHSDNCRDAATVTTSRRIFLRLAVCVGTTAISCTSHGTLTAQAAENTADDPLTTNLIEQSTPSVTFPDASPTPETVVLSSTPTEGFVSVDGSNGSSSLSVESKLQTEEKELVAELKADESDQIDMEKKDTQELITQLEKDEARVLTSEDGSPATEEKTQQLVERLEKDEEKTEAEIEQLIGKAEKLESDTEKSKAAKTPTDVTTNETKEFIAVLKERSVENKDLIETLKARSQKYYNSKTGRYESMSKDEFLKRKDEVLGKEHVAARLFDRIKEGITAAEEGLEADEKKLAASLEKEFPGLGDAIKKLSLRAKEEFLEDKAAVERLLEDEDLLEILRARTKTTEEFVSKYTGFLERLDGSLLEGFKSP